mgnify:CR=1 FL=1
MSRILSEKKVTGEMYAVICDDKHLEELVKNVLSPKYTAVKPNSIFFQTAQILFIVVYNSPIPTWADKIPVILICDGEDSHIPDDMTESGKIYTLTRPVDLKMLAWTADRILLSHCPNDVYVIDRDRNTVAYGEKSVVLTERELDLFTVLNNNRGNCVLRSDLSGSIWNGSDTNVSDVYVCYLRKKLESVFGPGTLITVRGKGYILK